MQAASVVVAALYKFVHLADYRDMRAPLLKFCCAKQLKGTLLLAEEGINGTVSGSRKGINALLDYLKADPRLADLEHKESFHSVLPFYRMKVKLKKEIVTMGVPAIRPEQKTGTRVGPDEWNTLIQDPDVVVIDTRNQYEYEVGTFENAISPETETFREFPEYVRQNLDPEKNKKIAMFCTGGIRCEKASAFMLDEGFEEVYQLSGGILKYLEDVPPDKNLWNGECFVFDGRVAVNEKLEPGDYVQCFACRRPLSPDELSSEKYQQGVSCLHCYDDLTEERKSRLAERQRQVELAEQRHYQHIGTPIKPKSASSESA